MSKKHVQKHFMLMKVNVNL